MRLMPGQWVYNGGIDAKKGCCSSQADWIGRNTVLGRLQASAGGEFIYILLI